METDKYHLELDVVTGVTHVVQRKVGLEHLSGAAVRVASNAQTASFMDNVSQVSRDAPPTTKVDTAVLKIGKVLNSNGKTSAIKTASADSRSSSTSTPSSVTSVFDRNSSAQSSSSRAASYGSTFHFSPVAKAFTIDPLTRTSSRKSSLGTRFTFSPQAKEFKPSTLSVFEIDRALIQRPRQGKCNVASEPSALDQALFEKLLQQTDHCPSPSADGPVLIAASLKEIDPAIVRKPRIDTVDSISKPSAADDEFFNRVLNQRSQSGQLPGAALKLAERYSLTPSRADRRIENIHETCFAFDIDGCRTTTEVKLPLEELSTEASQEQIWAFSNHVAQNGPPYKNAGKCLKASEGGRDQAAFQSSVPPQNNSSPVEEVLENLKLPSLSPGIGTKSRAFPPTTTPAVLEAQKGALLRAACLNCASTPDRGSRNKTRFKVAWLDLIQSMELDNPDFDLEEVDWSKPQNRTPRAPKACGLFAGGELIEERPEAVADSHENSGQTEASGSDDTASTVDNTVEIIQGSQESTLLRPPKEDNLVGQDERAAHLSSDDDNACSTLEAAEELAHSEVPQPPPPSDIVWDMNQQEGVTIGGGDVVQMNDSNQHSDGPLGMLSFPTLGDVKK